MCVPHSAFRDGGKGTAKLAEEIVKAAETPSNVKLTYDIDLPVVEKINTIATEIYGAKDIYFETKAEKELVRFKRMGYDKLPVCIA